MSFSLPTFNLSVDIYTGPWIGKVFRLNVLGNLAFSRRIQVGESPSGDPLAEPAHIAPLLLLPPLTDVRCGFQVLHGDVLEVPHGSGRWYGCRAIEDIGKGFPNEHRCALLGPISQFVNGSAYPGLFWPVPMT